MMRIRSFAAAVAAGLLVTVAPAHAQGNLQSYVTQALNSLSAKSSIFAKHLPSGRTIELRADVPMNTLSVIKIAVMLQAFRDVEGGKLKLTDRYLIRPEDLRRGSGLIQTFDAGLNPTYRDLIEQMIITSDNTATDIMIRTVGLARVNTMLAQLGFRETRLNRTTGDLFREVWIRADAKNATMTDREVYERGFPNDAKSSERSFTLEGDSTRWLGRTTAREMATLLEGILNAKYASKLSSDVMIGMLRRQFYASRLPQRIQYRASVAHKTGDWPPIAGNDVGIIFYEGGPAIVSVFTNQNTGDFFELESTLGRIAEQVITLWR
ncbi:MAG: serine hydrolase [Gemmatimonadaceae bacterium]